MENIKIVKVMEHYEIYRAGSFYCSCDNLSEVQEEIRKMEEEEET